MATPLNTTNNNHLLDARSLTTLLPVLYHVTTIQSRLPGPHRRRVRLNNNRNNNNHLHRNNQRHCSTW